jgi:hypothetical protein
MREFRESMHGYMPHARIMIPATVDDEATLLLLTGGAHIPSALNFIFTFKTD